MPSPRGQEWPNHPRDGQGIIVLQTLHSPEPHREAGLLIMSKNVKTSVIINLLSILAMLYSVAVLFWFLFPSYSSLHL
jgi:hypothetical protein